MIKKLLRIVFLCALFSQFFTKASAQYAIGGQAGNTLVKSVYWLTWDSGAAGSTMISHPADYNAFNITNGTYVWQFSPTVRIQLYWVTRFQVPITCKPIRLAVILAMV
jgi:hypothetical protein